MDTPPQYSVNGNGISAIDNSRRSTKKENVSLARTFTKTPSQGINLHQRTFKSELQLNRVSSRLINNKNSTALKITSRCTQSSTLTSRLKGLLVAQRAQKSVLSSVPVPEKVQTLKPTTTPNIRLIANNVTSTRNQNHNHINNVSNINSANNNNISTKNNNSNNTRVNATNQNHIPFLNQNLNRTPHHNLAQNLNINQNRNQNIYPDYNLGNLNQDNNKPSSNNENKTQHTHHTHHTQNTRTQYQQHHTRTQHTTAPPLDSIKYQISVKDKIYKVLRKIGSGGSAKVYEGFEPQSSQTVAIKIINIGGSDQRTRESYFNEKALLEKLRDSKHVVHMYDSEYNPDFKELIIVMEKGDADLAQVIDSHFTRRDPNSMTIDGTFIKFYWRGMLQAVNDIHRHGIVHADLKPVNFILVKNEIKLIDFGIANEVEPELTSIIRDYQIGTINYMAPEALRNRATDASFQLLNNDLDENNPHLKRTVIKYNSKADIWSLGCILYNLVYGRPPFDKYKDLVSKVQVITNPKQTIQFPEISNRHLMNCMKSCLRFNPAERPTAQELLKDPFLSEDSVILLQTTKLNQQNPQSL